MDNLLKLTTEEEYVYTGDAYYGIPIFDLTKWSMALNKSHSLSNAYLFYDLKGNFSIKKYGNGIYISFINDEKDIVSVIWSNKVGYMFDNNNKLSGFFIKSYE
jgi:hypothetical protein